MRSHRVALYSDIHYPAVITAWEPWIPPRDLDVEAIILAGDIHGTPALLAEMVRAIRATQNDGTWIIVVAGNGEYVGQEFVATRAAYREAITGIDRAVFLDNAVVELPSGLRVIGSIYWDQPTAAEVERLTASWAALGLEGVDGIRLAQRPLTLEDTLRLHLEARAFVEQQLRLLSPAQRAETIVCTHFWPQLEPPESTGFIRECGPCLWLVGHIHTSADFMLGDTRVVCNPRLGERQPSDDPKFVTYGVNPQFDEHRVLELAQR